MFGLLAVGSAMLAILLSLAQRVALRTDRSIRDWHRGSWAMALGYLAVLLRGWMPTPLSLVLGNLGTELALTFYAAALHRFLRGRAPPPWLWWWLGLQALVLLLVLPLAQPHRVTIVSTSHVLLLLPSLWWLSSGEDRLNPLMRGVNVTLWIAVIFILFRAVDAYLVPSAYATGILDGNRQGIAFLAAYIFLLGSGFGFALANLERAAQRMEVMAHTDALTGCWNRRAADVRLGQALEQGRIGQSPVALVLLDLDHFKRINDRHGHQIGDQVLQRFAQLVRSQLQPLQSLARLGGEEFAMVLPHSDDTAACRCAESVLAAVCELQVLDESFQAVRLTVSAGVAVCRPQRDVAALSTLADQLYRQADRALYLAKSSGRDRLARAADLPPRESVAAAHAVEDAGLRAVV